MSSPRALAVTVVALALLTACGGDPDVATDDETPKPVGGSSASPVGEAPTTSTSAATPSPVPGESPDLQAHPPSGAYDLVMTSVRARPHDGGTRVVVRFAGTGRPGWAAQYVDEAVQDGSGDVLDVAGDQVLRLDLTGTPTMPSDQLRPVRTSLGGAVVALRPGAAWEGVATVFVGLDGERAPLRVSVRDSPSRLVVDVG